MDEVKDLATYRALADEAERVEVGVLLAVAIRALCVRVERAEAERDGFVAALAGVGIERDDGQMRGGWWVAAEPGPAHEDTLLDALRLLVALAARKEGA